MAFMPGMGPDQVPPEWQQAQPSGLGGLAQGLRLAGGVLSPQVFRTVALEQEREDQRAQQQRLLEIQQTIKGVEAGAIPPEAAQMRLRQLGFQAPVGAGPEAQARMELVKQRQAMSEAMAKLPADASPAQRLSAMAPYMTADQQLKLYETTVNKQTSLETQLERIRNDFELRKRDLSRKEDKDALDARFKEIDSGIRQQLADYKSLTGGRGVHPVTIEDPENPGRMIVIDANTREKIGVSPQDTKIQGQFNQDTGAFTSLVTDLDRLAAQANELKDHPGLRSITGVRGAIPNIPGTAAANAEAKLNTLKSQVAFGVLQNMRNNSKTGGALGSVSDAEGKRLEANLAALEKAQSYGEFKIQLDKIIKYTDTAKDNLRGAYNRKWESRSGNSGANAGDAEASEARRAIEQGADPAAVRRRYKERTGKDL